MPSSSSPQTSTAEKISATSTAKQHTKAKITMHFCWDCKRGRRRTLISAACFLLLNTSVKTRPECPNLGPPSVGFHGLMHSSAVYNMIWNGEFKTNMQRARYDLACSGFHMKTWDGNDENKGKREEREQGLEREREITSKMAYFYQLALDVWVQVIPYGREGDTAYRDLKGEGDSFTAITHPPTCLSPSASWPTIWLTNYQFWIDGKK